MKVRRARPGEGPLVVDWIRASLSPAVAGMTIWASPRVDRYVEHSLATGSAAPTAYYLLETDAAETAGVAEFRRVGGAAFLNQIHISPKHRGRSLGRSLLGRAACDWTARTGASVITLDDETENRLAYRWYQRLGFRPLSETFWQVGGIRSSASRPAHIEGLEEAERQHEQWGFSRLTARTRKGPYTVDRLPGRFFRLDSLDAWHDDSVHATLREIDPSRRIVLLSPTEIDALETVRHSRRMSVDARAMMRALHPSSQEALALGSAWPG